MSFSKPRYVFAIAAVVLAGCSSGSGDGEGGGRGGEGASCTDGSNCAAGLLCFVKDADPTSGVCTQAPAACAAELECQCLDELKTQCGSTTAAASCVGYSGDYLLGCNQPAPRLDGETCSSVRYCDAGLYCFIPEDGVPGTCKRYPDACGTSPSCDCLEPVRQSCNGGSRCSVVGDSALISCH